MSSLREIRELLLDWYMNGVLSDEEFVLLYDENRSKNLDYRTMNTEDPTSMKWRILSVFLNLG